MTTRIESENAFVVHDDRGNEFREIVTFDKKPNGVGIDSLISILIINVPRPAPFNNQISAPQDFENAVVDQSRWNGNPSPVWTNGRINLTKSGNYQIQCRATIEWAGDAAQTYDMYGLDFELWNPTINIMDTKYYELPNNTGILFSDDTRLLSIYYSGYFNAGDSFISNFLFYPADSNTATTVSTSIIYTIIKIL